MHLSFLAVVPLLAASASDLIEVAPSTEPAASTSIGHRIDALVVDLLRSDWTVRDAAVTSLVALVDGPEGRRHAAKVVDRVALALEEPGAPTECALVLGRIGTDRARRVLASHLVWASDDDEAQAALAGLWHCATDAEASALLSVLESADPSSAVARKACLLLGRIRHEPATRLLIDRLHSPHRGEAVDAHWALRALTGLSLGPEPELWETWWARTGRDRGPVAR